MSSLGIITLPRDSGKDQLQETLRNVLQNFEANRRNQSVINEQKRQFDVTRASQEPLTVAQTENARALTAEAQARIAKMSTDEINARADSLTKDLAERAKEYAKNGLTTEAGQLVAGFMQNFDKTYGTITDPAAKEKFAALRTATADRVFSYFTQPPDNPLDQSRRNVINTTEDITGRVSDAHGVVGPNTGATAPDLAFTSKLAGAEQQSYVFGDVQQREIGPAEHKQAVAIASDRAVGATPQLQAKTQRDIAAEGNATQTRIARERIASDERIAAGAQVATGAQGHLKSATDAVASLRKGAEAAKDIARLSKEVLADPSFSGAFGIKNWFAQPPTKDEPFAGTPEAAIGAKVAQIKALVTIPQMQVMKGLGQQSDKEFQNIQSSVTTLSGRLSEKDASAELGRLSDNAAALFDRYERLRETADKHFGGDIVRAAEYVRTHGGDL